MEKNDKMIEELTASRAKDEEDYALAVMQLRDLTEELEKEK